MQLQSASTGLAKTSDKIFKEVVSIAQSERTVQQPEGRRRILSLVIKDRRALHAAYMPFIKNGGLFVPTNQPYQLGDELFLLVQLLDEPDRIPVAGQVVWVTPSVPKATARRALASSSRNRKRMISDASSSNTCQQVPTPSVRLIRCEPLLISGPFEPRDDLLRAGLSPVSPT